MIEPAFIERCFGEAEGLTKQERNTKFPDANYPGLETTEALCQRAEQDILSTVEVHKGKTLLIVAHGSILKAILTSISNGSFKYEDGKELVLIGKISILTYINNTFAISALNTDFN